MSEKKRGILKLLIENEGINERLQNSTRKRTLKIKLSLVFDLKRIMTQ